MVKLDQAIFRALNGLSGQSAAFDAVAIFLAVGLIFVMAAAVVIMAAHASAKKYSVMRREENARDLAMVLRTSAAVVGAILDSALISIFFWRDRPFVTQPEVNLLIDPPLTIKSFPSDHSVIAFAIAVTVLLMYRKPGIALLVCAIGVAAGRVLVGVHYPVDVLTGAALGSVWAVAVTLVARHLKDVEWVKGQLELLHK